MVKKKQLFKIAKNRSDRKEDDTRKRIRRMVNILHILDSAKAVSCRELADEFNVSIRTVQRDLDVLNEDFPIASPVRGRHEFVEGYSLKQCNLTPEEASLMSFFHEMASSLGGPIEETYRSLYKKLVHTEYDSSFYAKMPGKARLDKRLPFVRELDLAIDECSKIEIHYASGDKDKWFRLDPLKIISYEGFWYLLARVDGKDWILKFRIERIKDLTALDESFDPPDNLEAMLAQSTNAWFNEKRDKKVVLLVTKDAAPFFRQKDYFPLQKIKKENKDGSLVIETVVCDYMEVLPALKSWIPEIMVLEPEELKRDIAGMLKNYLKKSLLNSGE